MQDHLHELVQLSLKYTKAKRTALDVGSKFGHYSFHLKDVFEMIHCFDMRDKMRWRNFHTYKNVKLHRFALGNFDGDTFHIGAHTTTDPQGLPCKVSRLDGLGYENVDHIKIDVEGDELAVLQGSEATILRDRPVIVIEQNLMVEKYQKGQRLEALYWLQSRGYSIRERLENDYILAYGL